MYSTITVKDKDYKLRLTAKGCVDLEKKLGTNPLNPIIEIANKGQMPSLNVLLTILHAALQPFEHGMTMDKVYDLYDDFIEEGNTMMDLIPIILEIFKSAGFLPEDTEVDSEEKN